MQESNPKLAKNMLTDDYILFIINNKKAVNKLGIIAFMKIKEIEQRNTLHKKRKAFTVLHILKNKNS